MFLIGAGVLFCLSFLVFFFVVSSVYAYMCVYFKWRPHIAYIVRKKSQLSLVDCFRDWAACLSAIYFSGIKIEGTLAKNSMLQDGKNSGDMRWMDMF